jgi:hypothetical protein
VAGAGLDGSVQCWRWSDRALVSAAPPQDLAGAGTGGWGAAACGICLSGNGLLAAVVCDSSMETLR